MTDQQKDTLGRLLLDNDLLLAVAESLTSGFVQSIISTIDGAATFFAGGATTYTIDAKARVLGVDRSHAEEVNAVSERVAAEMARGTCRLFGADIGLGATGYATPDPTRGVETPYAFLALYWKNRRGEDFILVKKFDGDGLARDEMRRRVSEEGLRQLLRELQRTGKQIDRLTE